MGSDRFDSLTRTVSTLLSRRTLAGALGLSVLALPVQTEAKKKHKKHKKKKVKLNDFGCVNVGDFCKNSGQCCSGICQGKKGKKKCKAHDEGTCQPGQDTCEGVPVPCTTTAGTPGGCVVTTGTAPYCENTGDCFDCGKDADCVPFCGDGAACIVCEGSCGPSGTACVGSSGAPCVF